MFDPMLLKMIVLPGNPPAGFGAQGLSDLSYAHYKTVWDRTFTRRAGEGTFDPYGYFRQDVCVCLMYEDVIAAQALSSTLHLDAAITQDLSYFQNFKGEGETQLRAHGVRSIATCEYSSVDRNFSPRMTERLSLNEIINDLIPKHGFLRGVDAIVGLPRRVTGTPDRAEKIGFRKVGERRERLGLSVDVMIGFEAEILPHGDLQTRALIDKLWMERTDFTFAPKLIPSTKRNPLEGTL